MNRIKKAVLTCCIVAVTILNAQNDRKDKGAFQEQKNEFFEGIEKGIQLFNEEKKEPRKVFKMDISGVDAPKSAGEFKRVWADTPESQGMTGTCWCFSTTSFYEAEIYRLSKQQIKLSELYTVYWQYVEKAREFVRTRGKSAFGEGSETNGVAAMMKKYGVVPYESYTGMRIGQKFHDHERMFDEMNKYLISLRNTNAWNEEEAIATVKAIMNYYIGEPPSTVTVGGKKITPQEYLKTVAKLNPDDYADFMSLMEKDYWTQAEYKVEDNWWHSADYYNVPLDDFMDIVKNAGKNGFSISIGGDVSESGLDSKSGIAMVPTFDIPSAYIDENARQFRFSNKSTTDDHAMHLVGYTEKPNGTWFLIKDSGSGGHNNTGSPGYWFMHEDYVKLKMMTITLHKDAVKDILAKFPKK